MAPALPLPDHPCTAFPTADAPAPDDETRWLRQALEHMPVGFCLLDEHDRLRLWNDRWAELYRLPDRLRQVGAHFSDIFVSSGAVEREHMVARPRPARGNQGSRKREFLLPDGRVVEVLVFSQPDGTTVSLHEDVTEQRAAEQRVAWQARHDALTGLANRSLLHERLTSMLVEGGDEGAGGALFYVDLDRFKSVNDHHGHAMGDALLGKVAERLRGCCRRPAVIARLGGDEFAIVVSERETREAVRTLGTRVVDTLSAPYEIDGRQLRIGASVGAAIAPEAGHDADTLLKHADLAMYRAKGAGRGTVVLFEPGMDVEVHERGALDDDLRGAFERDELTLRWQPRIDSVSGEISGVEALPCWIHPERGRMDRASVESVAERTGLLRRLGCRVLEGACRAAASWSSGLPVTVEVSASHLGYGVLAEDVAEALRSSALAPVRLEIRVAESGLSQDHGIVSETLFELRRHGVRLTMGDVGTGRVSLDQLRRLPFDRLRIDASLVAELGTDPEVCAVLRAVVGLGNGLGMRVSAAGVNGEPQYALLRDQGCAEMQGELFAPVCDTADLDATVSGARARARAITARSGTPSRH